MKCHSKSLLLSASNVGDVAQEMSLEHVSIAKRIILLSLSVMYKSSFPTQKVAESSTTTWEGQIAKESARKKSTAKSWGRCYQWKACSAHKGMGGDVPGLFGHPSLPRRHMRSLAQRIMSVRHHKKREKTRPNLFRSCTEELHASNTNGAICQKYAPSQEQHCAVPSGPDVFQSFFSDTVTQEKNLPAMTKRKQNYLWR